MSVWLQVEAVEVGWLQAEAVEVGWLQAEAVEVGWLQAEQQGGRLAAGGSSKISVNCGQSSNG